MIDKIIADIKSNVLEHHTAITEHYISTQPNAKERKAAQELLNDLVTINERVLRALNDMKHKNTRLNGGTDVMDKVQKKLYSDYQKSEQFFQSMTHIANEFALDKRELTKEATGALNEH